MKFLGSQIAYLFTEAKSRQNLKLLGKLVLVLIAIILFWAVLFHFIMEYAEGRNHSWFTGIYWALTVMSTLGFGDITFHTDIGRVFSSVVLLSGVVFMLSVMPFAVIRFFYAPWVEAQARLKTPRHVEKTMSGHVIIARYDDIARDLVPQLKNMEIPYVVIEEESQRATDLLVDGINVIVGDFDRLETLNWLRASHSRLLVANLDDASNCNLTLTFREETATVPVTAIVENWDSVDVLELSGANHVIPLKHLLGQHLASRVTVGRVAAHVVGKFHQLLLAELAVHDTPLSGLLIRETKLRERMGLNIVGVWNGGHFSPTHPDIELTPKTVLVLLGTQEQLDQFDLGMTENSYQDGITLALVLGGGKVGRAAGRSLRKRGAIVHLIEKNTDLAPLLNNVSDKIIYGDAADREVLMSAGLSDASSVVITTNDDAVNIYLSIYCRQLNPRLRIISRISHSRNLAAIHRAGADFVLSAAILAVRSLVADLLGREMIILGVGADIIEVTLPERLEGKTLAQSEIGKRTGLNVVAVQSPDGEVSTVNPGFVLEKGCVLVMIGTMPQLSNFRSFFVS